MKSLEYGHYVVTLVLTTLECSSGSGLYRAPSQQRRIPQAPDTPFGQMGNYQMLDAAAQMLTRLMIWLVKEVVSTGIAYHYPGAIYAL